VEEAMELLHEDYAYEFQIGWNLWELETGPEAQRAVGGRTQDSGPKATTGPHSTHPPDGGFAQGGLSTSLAAQNAANSAQDDNQETDAQDDNQETDAQDDNQETDAQDDNPQTDARDESEATRLDARWARGPRLVRVTGYGPLFDEGTYEQDGHIRIDFGSDAPFLEEDVDLSEVGARHVAENVRQLVELTAGVEKASGATARLLWSELGESLAQRLAARLGMEN
jgi:hypothetical protein